MSAQTTERSDFDLDAYRRARTLAMDRARFARLAAAKAAGIDTSMKPAAPVADHLQRLTGIGWTLGSIAAMHGEVTPQALSLILRGVSRQVEPRVARITDLPITVTVPTHLHDTAKVPTLGATRRIRALMRLGYTHRDLTAELGRCTKVFSGGHRSHTRAMDWRAVDDMYDRLSATRGPSETTAGRAQAMGFAPPLAWHNIDDPFEDPCGDRAADGVDPILVDLIFNRALDGTPVRGHPTTRAEKVEVVARWRATGRSVTELSRLTGWNVQRYYDGDGEGLAPAPEPSARTGLEDLDPVVLHDAAISIAEAAITGGWLGDLAGVLEQLGITEVI